MRSTVQSRQLHNSTVMSGEAGRWRLLRRERGGCRHLLPEEAVEEDRICTVSKFLRRVPALKGHGAVVGCRASGKGGRQNDGMKEEGGGLEEKGG
eukprot:897681-Rhodomonas_salina.1